MDSLPAELKSSLYFAGLTFVAMGLFTGFHHLALPLSATVFVGIWSVVADLFENRYNTKVYEKIYRLLFYNGFLLNKVCSLHENLDKLWIGLLL